jgi:hypothetical protein
MSTHPLTHPCTPAPLARRSNSGAFPVYTYCGSVSFRSISNWHAYPVPAYPHTRRRTVERRSRINSNGS